MEYALGALVILLALAAVVHPLVRPGASGDASDPAGPDGQPSLEARRTAIYREIADLQFDHRLGKLDAADYLELRETLLGRAAELLAEDDRRRLLLDRLVEHQIAELRTKHERSEPVGWKAPDPS